MRTIILFALAMLLGTLPVVAQDGEKPLPLFTFPTIVDEGQEIADFMPPGWHSRDVAYGNLDEDRREDCAVVIEGPEAVRMLRKGGGEAYEWDGRPRILLVLLARSDGGYRLACQANNAIMSDTEGGMMGDPFDGLAIEKGTIVTNFWGGSADKWRHTYRYRLQKGEWYLIGATYSGGRNPETFYSYDYNLNTGKLVVEREDQRVSKKRKRYTKQLERSTLPLLRSHEPGTIEVEKDVYL